MDDNEYSSQLPELGEFLGELGLVLQNATKFGMTDVCWSANVLLSIDDGYDAPGVTIDIAKQLIAGGIVFKSTQVPAVQSFTIPAAPDKAEPMWNQAFAFIEKCSIAERSRASPLLLIDLPFSVILFALKNLVIKTSLTIFLDYEKSGAKHAPLLVSF